MPSLYQHQQDGLDHLLAGKKILILEPGLGKTGVAMCWAEQMTKITGKRKVLVVTTASKCKARTANGDDDFTADARLFCTSSFIDSSSSLSLISWHKLFRWVNEHWSDLDEYIIIFDECVPADTKVETINGEVEIADLQVGDKVLSYNHNTHQTEYKKVTRLIKKPSPKHIIRLLLSDGTAIMSTMNHPHWTQRGYVEAKNIKRGDFLYERQDGVQKKKIRTLNRLCSLRKKYANRRIDAQADGKVTQKQKLETMLFRKVCKRGTKQTNEKTMGGKQRSNDGGEIGTFKKMVGGTPRSKTGSRRKIKKYCLHSRVEKGGIETDDRAEQKCVHKKESARNERKEWVETNLDRKTRIKRREWTLHKTTNTVSQQAEQNIYRLGDGTTSKYLPERGRLSDLLQSRHRKSILQNSDRMRWGVTLLRQSKKAGQEEGRQIKPIRVESVEILKLEDIKRLGLYRDPGNVYCIDVEHNHNFFANGILTHNCQKSKSGISSQMGKAFLKITKRNHDWIGMTATPGDSWLSYYAYFTACGLVRNKTAFMAEFANVQTFKGYPEIVGWRNEGKLHNMWAAISYAPDARKALQELPNSVSRPITFSLPKTYATVLKTRLRAGSDGSNYDEDLLDTPMALCSELRRVCFTKDKQEWVSDFIAGLGTQAVVFYNFVATGDKLEEIISKALPEGARIWRIDGKHHEIPTAETLGSHDIVLSQWQSGSEGLNLQAIHYELLVELPYSYSMLKQGLGRIRRIGQKHTTFFYTLLCDKGIEQDIKKILKTKGDFALREWCTNNNLIKEEKYG